MVNDRESNLVNIDGQIQRFKSSLVRRIKAFFRLNPNLDETDKAELKEIRSRIELIEINQSAIFLAHQPERNEKELTQQDLLAHHKAVQLAKLNYTHQQIQQLHNDMQDPEGIYYRLARKHPKLFKKITPILGNMIQVLKEGMNLSEEEINLHIRNPLYSTASTMGGRYSVFNQGFDPLALTNVGGSCYGYVASWVKQIAAGKPGMDFLRPNREIREKQINQFAYRLKTEENQSVFSTQHGTYLHTADQLLQKVDANAVYGIRLLFAEGVGHIIGLRKIASTGEIECYDPNYGIFAFKDELAFKTWFIALLASYNPGPSMTVGLTTMGTQGPQTSSFVPAAIAQEIKNPSFFLPQIDLRDSNETCKEKLNEFYENIQFAGMMLLRGSITEKDNFIIQDSSNRQHDSYKSYLKALFFSKEELKINHKLDPDRHVILKRKVCEAIDHQIAVSTSQNLKEFLKTLKEHIDQVPQTVSLEILISHVLSQKQPGKSMTWAEALSASDKEVISHLSKNFEISPLILMLLQEKLLFEIVAAAASFPESNKQKEVNHAIKKYLTGEFTLTEVFSHLQKITSNVQMGFFAKRASTGRTAVDNFYQLLRKIDPTNPHSISIAQEQSKAHHFLQKATSFKLSRG